MRANRNLYALGVIGVLIVGGAALSTGSSKPAALPGARPVIDASDYPSIQAALDALPEGGGVVRLPAGTFEIREPLVVHRSDVLLEGAGTATHIKNLSEDGRPALVLSHPNGAKVKGPDKLWRIEVRSLRLSGNPKSGHGILAVQVNEVFLNGVTVTGHGGDGVRLDNCYEDPRVCDSLLTYNKATGLNLVGCHDIVVSGNQFEENQDALHCFDGFNLCMSGNCLDDHLGNGVVVENTYGSVVAGNMFEECQGTAVILDRDCYGITVSANVIAHNGGGVDLRDAHGCAVSANTLTINKADAVRIGAGSGRITVTGNNFSDSYIGQDKLRRAANDRAAGGLTLAGGTDVAISGNVFAGVRPAAIEVKEPTERVLIGDNALTDVPWEPKTLGNATLGPNLAPEPDAE